MMQFNNIYQNKKVVITGNTGFKGSWLSIWLHHLGAKVYGISVDVPTDPSNFILSKLDEKTETHFVDIRDFDKTYMTIKNIVPDFIFHLAAQPIVKESYDYPLKTIETNVLGTANILETVRKLNNNCTCVIITSDKCYDNSEWVWGYRETDLLGGEDPYSASKGAAELVIKTYAKSYFANGNSKAVSARAGNVIGGGDWAKYRIVPDAIRAWTKNEILKIRNPKSTRPWQHVLEPLGGYLLLGQKLFENSKLNGESFNFGPNSNQNYTVNSLLQSLSGNLNNGKWDVINQAESFSEAGLLKLNCDKSFHILNWEPVLNFEETTKFVAEWYSNYYNDENVDMYNISVLQIENYLNQAKIKNLKWISDEN